MNTYQYYNALETVNDYLEQDDVVYVHFIDDEIVCSSTAKDAHQFVTIKQTDSEPIRKLKLLVMIENLTKRDNLRS